jgi:PAS domain S-box-containing protein
VGFLWAIALSVILLGSVHVLSSFLHALESRKTYLSEAADAISRLVASYVESNHRGVIELSIAVEEIGATDRARLERRLQEFHRRSPEILTLIVTDAQGSIIASERHLSEGGGPSPQIQGLNISDRDYFRQPRATGRPYVSEAFFGRGFGRDAIVAVSAPWRSADGEFAGIVEGSLNLDRMGTVGALFEQLPSVEIFLVDGHDQLLWSGPARQGGPLSRVVLDDRGARLQGEPPRRVLSGQARVPGTLWSVAIQQPIGEIYRSTLPQAWITLSWMAAVFILATLFAQYLSRRITRPLEEVTASLDRVELGAAPPAPLLPETNAPHEVATIVHSTRRLLDRLQASYADLSRLLAEREAAIEGEIQQRTRAEHERDQLFILSLDMLGIAGFDGYFKQLNPAWEKALGWTLAELMAIPYLELVHPEDAEATLREMQKLRLGGTTSDFENRFRTKDGAWRWLSWCSASLPERGLIYAVARDVNERKKLERMKNDFISVVSHELRTPLTSIHGSLALILGGVAGELPEKARTLTGIAAKNSERLVRLVNDILDIEKIGSGTMLFRPALVELMPLVEQSVENNRSYAHQFDVEIRIAAAARASIWADPDRLQQVLANLLSNAAKHSPRGGVIEVGVQRDDGRVCVSVTDHGKGIPPEFQPRIFEKFAQADTTSTRQKGGTGLGLSISKAIVDRHGGRLWFETTPGAGTTFAFELLEWTEEEPLQTY